MQDSQNVHLDPRETGAPSTDLARVAKEESLRRRKNHSGGGEGVQFSTIFAMVDSSLEIGADSLRKVPKRQAQKDADSEKVPDLPVPAAAETKVETAKALVETPKAKAEQEQKPRVAKESVAKKPEMPDVVVAQAAILQAKVHVPKEPIVRTVERAEIKVERREIRAADRPKAPETRGAQDAKDRQVESQQPRKTAAQTERHPMFDQDRTTDRRVKQRSKDDADHAANQRDDKRPAEGPKGVRADDDAAKKSRERARPDEKPPTQRAEAGDARAAVKKPDEDSFSDQKRTEDAGQSNAGKKKRSIEDLEKLTGLQAKTVIEAVPMMAPTMDLALKSALESTSRGSVDTVRGPVKAAPTPASSGAQQNGGGADAQNRSSQAQDKLGQTAKRLTSYLSGKTESLIKPESTFSDMVAKAKLFVDNGRTEMNIQLKPEQLGSLNIKLTVEDGKMQAQFVTDRAEVKALIEQNEGTLKDKLAEVGIEVSAISVEVRSDTGQAHPRDDRPSGLRKVTEFGGGDGADPFSGSNDAQISYALAGMGTHLSLVA